MLTSLDAEGMKKDQLHVENMDGVSPYFNNENHNAWIKFTQEFVAICSTIYPRNSEQTTYTNTMSQFMTL